MQNHKDYVMDDIKNNPEDTISKPTGESQPSAADTKLKYKQKKVKKPMLKKLAVVVSVLLIAVGIIAALYFLVYKSANDYAIKVGSTTISNEQYAKLVGDFEELTEPILKDEKELQNYIVDTLKIREVASKYGIDVTSTEVSEYAKNYYTADTPTDLQLLAAERMMYESSVEKNKENKKRVAYIAVPFSLHFASGQGAGPGGVDPEGYGDEAVIQADKTLALERVNEYRAKLTDSPTPETAEKIINEIKTDSVLSYGITKNQSAMYYIDKTGDIDYGNKLLKISIGEEEANTIYALNGSVTEVLTETGNQYFSTVKGYDFDGVEIAYYMYVDLGGNNDPQIEQNIANDTKNIKVVIHV